jgi:stage IV sporulation protein FB
MSFTLFTIGKTRVRLNALFLLPLFFAFFTGNGYVFLLTVIALSLHEAAHAAMAFACGAQIAQIDIHPLGLSASLLSAPLSAGDNLAIAAAGPVFSLTAGIAAALVYESGILRSESLKMFANVNTILAFINLLPAPPLDGSAMIAALASRRFSEKTICIMLGMTGMVTAALLTGVSIYLYALNANFYLTAMVAVFLLIAAIKERNKAHGGRAAAMLRRNAALGAARVVNVREIALNCGVTANEALRLGVSGQYTRFIVLGEDFRELGVLNENDLYEGIAKHGSGVPLKSLIASSIDQRATW